MLLTLCMKTSNFQSFEIGFHTKKRFGSYMYESAVFFNFVSCGNHFYCNAAKMLLCMFFNINPI